MKEEFVVFLTMIEPPSDEGVESNLAEAMKRLPPTDYLFAKATFEVIQSEPKAADWKRCLCAAAWGNPFAMRSLQSHFLRRSSEAPYDGLYAYWNQAQAKTGIGDLCRLNIVDKMELIARAYHNHDTPPLEDGKPYFHHVKKAIDRLKERGYTAEANPLVIALGYGCELFTKTKLTPAKLSAFGNSMAGLEEMKRLADLIEMCNRDPNDGAALPPEVAVVRTALK